MYSVIVPVFNSAQTIQILCDQISVVFRAIDLPFEIILVNDSSFDSSWQTIQEIKTKYMFPIIDVSLSENIGQHAALHIGMQYAKGMFIVTLDDDLQFPASEIAKLVERQRKTNAELVYGIPKSRNHSTVRNLASRVALFFFHYTVGTSKKATSFRLIKRALVEKIINTKRAIVFIDGMLAKYNPKTSHVFVEHRERLVGKSGHNLIKQAWWTLKILFTYSIRS
jgi:polyisoprenyl-phosphate glycosyltransferase